MASFLQTLVRDGAAGRRIVNDRNGETVASAVLTAFDSRSRRQGLLHRDGLPDGSALVIAPSNAIHTFFMRFPIDVAFVARDGRVLKTRARVPPWRMSGSLRAFCVVELPAGSLAQHDTRTGDRLVIA